MMDTFRRPRMAALSELCILGLLTAVLASGCGTSAPSAGSSQGGGEASGSASSAVETMAGADASEQDAPGERPSLPVEGGGEAGSGQAAGSGGEEVPGGDASKEETPATSYDFTQPAPEREAVDNTYFEDAAFVGDSRTDGFMIYSGIGCGDNLTSNGLSIFKLEEKKAITIDGEKYTLLEALARKEYGKVYLSLGVNELGYYDDQGFYEAYCRAIDAIRVCQPNAVIYIQGLIPLNEDVIRETGGRSYLTNEHLVVYNDLMRQAAQEKQVVFLDLYSEFADESGQLPAEASKDGVHLRSEWCRQWLDYLKTHTVDYDALYPQGTAAPAEGTEGGEEAR